MLIKQKQSMIHRYRLGCLPGLAMLVSSALGAAEAELDKALVKAVRAGLIEDVRGLLADGADPNAKTGAGRTVLMTAAYNGNRRIVNLILAEGVNVNEADSNQNTALMDAAFSGDVELAKSLLARGADPKYAAKSGTTALTVAKARGHLAMVQFLESLSAEAEDSGGKKKKAKKKK